MPQGGQRNHRANSKRFAVSANMIKKHIDLRVRLKKSPYSLKKEEMIER
jgi:hypothetical protein